MEQDKKRLVMNMITDMQLSKDNVSVDMLKSKLQNVLGEKPAIKLNYKKDSRVDEANGGILIEFEILDSIELIYTKQDFNPKTGALPVVEKMKLLL